MANVIDKIQRSRTLRALAHKGTMLLGEKFTDTFPMIFVLGFPKSGTTWACQLVADVLKMPYPQFALLPHTFSTVVHGHELSKPSYSPQVYVVRDGRDVAVSMFHYEMRKLQPGSQRKIRGPLNRIFPKNMPAQDKVLDYFPPFIELFLKKPTASPVPWGVHVKTFLDYKSSKQSLVLYEKLLSSGVEELRQCLEIITDDPPDSEAIASTLDKFSFKRLQEKSKTGAALRKGVAGDWKQHFTKETAQMFNDAEGGLLIELGYESNDSWTENL